MTQQTISGRERLAALTGRAIRRIGLGIPGTVGPGLVVVAAAGVDWRAGTLVAGVILWALDRRVP
jgi:hypothetical protein